MNNVIPIRPGVRPDLDANRFTVRRFAPIAPAAQAQTPTPTNPWKVAAVVLGGILVYEVVTGTWHKAKERYGR